MNINWDLLVDKAMHGREFAYVPYSHFKVGSAVLLKDGSIIYGCNVENASYPNGTCSERNTLQKMISRKYGNLRIRADRSIIKQSRGSSDHIWSRSEIDKMITRTA